MKNSYKMGIKAIVGTLVISNMLIFAGCTAGEAGASETTISIKKDGSVLSHIEESFEQSYYSQEELQQQILAEVSDYNRKTGDSCISVEKIEAANSVATVQMTYKEAKNYAEFNGVTFFVGTPGEASASGYNMDVVLSGVKDSNETLGKADILATEDFKLIIFDTQEPVSLEGKALFVSDNVIVADNQKSVSISEGSDKLAYILYK